MRVICRQIGFLLLIATPWALARGAEGESAPLDPITKWKVVNFTIFVILLGYFIAKYSPRFFNARTADIQRAIQEATGLKMEADFRYSEMDRKMATLGEEVNRLREHSAHEMEREHQAVLRETESEIEHIQRNMRAEIDALRGEGALHVREHTAQMAFALAERRLADRLASGRADDFVPDLIHLVREDKSR